MSRFRGWVTEWLSGQLSDEVVGEKRFWAMTGSSQGPFMTGRAGQGVYELGQWVETPLGRGLGRLGLLRLGGWGGWWWQPLEMLRNDVFSKM